MKQPSNILLNIYRFEMINKRKFCSSRCHAVLVM